MPWQRMEKEYGEKLWKFSEVQGKYNQALPVFRFSVLVLPVWNNHIPGAPYSCSQEAWSSVWPRADSSGLNLFQDIPVGSASP